uniref:Uncharacterized protein n=1 Tax=Caenorhabditis japonica TaxID=281687 RepID=A0A8R1ING7_CAEJA
MAAYLPGNTKFPTKTIARTINDRAERPNVRGLHNPAFYEFTYRHFFDTDSVGCPSLRPARRRSLRLLLENGIFDESVSEDDSSSHI